jgi:hypothetical protein
MVVQSAFLLLFYLSISNSAEILLEVSLIVYALALEKLNSSRSLIEIIMFIFSLSNVLVR